MSFKIQCKLPSSISIPGLLFSIQDPRSKQTVYIYGYLWNHPNYQEALKANTIVQNLLLRSHQVHSDRPKEGGNKLPKAQWVELAKQITADTILEAKFRTLIRKLYDLAKKEPKLQDSISPLQDNDFKPETSPITERIVELFVVYLKFYLLTYQNDTILAQLQLPTKKIESLPLENTFDTLYDQALTPPSSTQKLMEQLDQLEKLITTHNLKQSIQELLTSWEQGDVEKLRAQLPLFDCLVDESTKRIDQTTQAIFKLFDGFGTHFVFCYVDNLCATNGILAQAEAKDYAVTKLSIALNEKKYSATANDDKLV